MYSKTIKKSEKKTTGVKWKAKWETVDRESFLTHLCKKCIYAWPQIDSGLLVSLF